MNKLNGKEINMESFEDFVTQIGLDGIMKGRSPEFYNNMAQALGGLMIWNISLILGLFINFNNMHWVVYMILNVMMLMLAHYIGVVLSLYFGRINGWWKDKDTAKMVYALQWESLKRLVKAVKKDINEKAELDENGNEKNLDDSLSDEEPSKKDD